MDNTLLRNCKKCDLCSTRIQVVCGVGPPKGNMMIIGRNPGAQEDREGYPFVGGAGGILNRLLKDAGIKRSQCYVTNVVKCFTPKNREPSPIEVKSCIPYLIEEIRAYKPNIIIALGDLALKALTGKQSITTFRGSLLTSSAMNIKVLPTFHPAYIMRGQHEYWSTVVSDLTRAKQEETFPEINLVPLDYQTYDPFKYSLEWIEDTFMDPEKYISFDIETPGVLKPWQGGVIGISFGYGMGKALHFNVRNLDMAYYILRGPAPKVVQRATFDVFFLKYHGVEVNNVWFDTKLAQHIISPVLPNGLPYLASVHTDVPFYKPSKNEEGGGVVSMSAEKLAEYNNTDAEIGRAHV
jgi:uracil-DNA glycosylase family 4